MRLERKAMAKKYEKFGAAYHRAWNAAHRELVNARAREYWRRKHGGETDEKKDEKAKAVIEWHKRWLERRKGAGEGGG